MYTFKRGFSHAVIHSLTFGIDKLVCSSDSGTLHVFLMDKHATGLTTGGEATEDGFIESEETKDESGAWRVGTMIKSVISSVVPKDYEEALSMDRA